MTQINRNPSISDRERASASDSKTRIKGSVTVESALTIPLFLFAVMCLVYLLEIQAIRFSIGTAAHGAAKIAAEDAAIHPFFNPVKFQADLVNLRSGTVGPEHYIRRKQRYPLLGDIL